MLCVWPRRTTVYREYKRDLIFAKTNSFAIYFTFDTPAVFLITTLYANFDFWISDSTFCNFDTILKVNYDGLFK